MKLIVKPATCTLAVALLVSAGCGASTPSQSVAPSPTAVTTLPAESPTSSALASPTPAQASPTPPGSAASAITDLTLDVHQIPAAFTGHISALVSLGSEILWSGGKTEDNNNLYRYVPGQAEPDLLYQNPGGDSYLTNIAGSTAGYVFTDDRWIDGEPRGWRLWYLAGAGASPLLLDQSTDDRLPSPTLSMNGEYIAWQVVHGTWQDPVTELRVTPVDDPAQAVTLLSNPGRDTYVQFPKLWGNELWYGFVDNDWDAGAEYPRVEMIDLADPVAGAVVFGQDQRAFMPAPGNDIVAWKSGGEEGLSALNSGALSIYWRETAKAQTLPIPGPSRLAERISYPSVGNRFVAWWDDIRQLFYVYDLRDQGFRRIAEYDLTGDESVTRPSVSGDLLAFVHSVDEDHRALEWAWLPD